MEHKRTFFYLEQLILKHNADAYCLNIKEIHEVSCCSVSSAGLCLRSCLAWHSCCMLLPADLWDRQSNTSRQIWPALHLYSSSWISITWRDSEFP